MKPQLAVKLHYYIALGKSKIKKKISPKTNYN